MFLMMSASSGFQVNVSALPVSTRVAISPKAATALEVVTVAGGLIRS